MGEYRCTSNNFGTLDNSISDIINKLVQESDDLWKCLKYGTMDALSQSITLDDKRALIDQSLNARNTRRLLLKRFNNDIVDENRTELRIYVDGFSQFDVGNKNIQIGFQIINHKDLWVLDETKQRINVILHEIFKILEQSRIENLNGRLNFNDQVGEYVQFNDNYEGYEFTMIAGGS